MAFCKKCGAQLEDDAKFCPMCGATTEEEEQKAPEADAQPAPDPEDVKKNMVMAILAYFGILILVPALTDAKNSPYVRFHMNQGLVLTLFSVGLAILAAIPFVRFVSLAALVIFAFQIVGIVYAAKGEMKEVPLLGRIKIIK